MELKGLIGSTLVCFGLIDAREFNLVSEVSEGGTLVMLNKFNYLVNFVRMPSG